MPAYEFQSQDGDIITRFFAMADAPTIGAAIQHNYKTYRRVFCGRIDTAGIARKTHQYPFASESLPHDIDFGCKRDDKGRQVINSQAQERDVLARASAYSRRIGEGDWERD